VLVADGCFTLSLCENLKKQWLRRLVKIYCQILLVVLPLFLIIRSVLYAEVEKRSPSEDPLQRFGGFFAVYCDDLTLSLATSSTVLGLYVLCYVVICLVICKVSELNAYISVEE
jgi:hypothetical protein